MKSAIKLSIFYATPFIIVLVLFGSGLLAGRYTVTRNFDKKIKNASKAYFLGNLLPKKQQRGMTRAYLEGDKVLKEMGNISWAVPNVPTPFVGNAPMPGQHGTAHINSMQFRADNEVAIPKPEDTYRIFITGGSTAYGSGAPGQSSTIAGYLNSILKEKGSPETGMKYEVFTMANPAWASTHERIVIENRLSELEPDMIISFSGNNDVHWGILGRNVLWFRSYADEYFLSLIKTAYRVCNQPDLPEITKIEQVPIPPSLITERLLKNVVLSSFVLAEKNIDYFFMLQPTLAVTGKKLTKREQASLHQQDFFRECYKQIDTALSNFHRENFHYINLSDIFDSIGNQEDIFLDSYHFGDKGNEIIAEHIFSHIKGRISQ